MKFSSDIEIPNLKERSDEITKCFTKDFEKCTTLLTYLAVNLELQGFTVDIFKILAQVANFTPHFKLNIDSDEPLEMSKHPIMQIYVGSYGEALRGYSPTALAFDSYFLLAATPAEFYTNYEKLWLPFDHTTWILLFVTFLGSFSFIFVVSLMPRNIKNSTFGRDEDSPALNVVQVFFGISQMKLPEASIPRFILMLFIGFCLIVRTCYQSKSFELMTSDVRKPPPSTIQDLVDRNFTIVSCTFGHDKILKEIISDENNRWV